MPYGIFCWMCEEAIKMKSAEALINQLIWFFGAAFFCYGFHLLIFLPLFYYLVLHKNPFKFYLNIIPAIVFAFASSSR